MTVANYTGWVAVVKGKHEEEVYCAPTLRVKRQDARRALKSINTLRSRDGLPPMTSIRFVRVSLTPQAETT